MSVICVIFFQLVNCSEFCFAGNRTLKKSFILTLTLNNSLKLIDIYKLVITLVKTVRQEHTQNSGCSCFHSGVVSPFFLLEKENIKIKA